MLKYMEEEFAASKRKVNFLFTIGFVIIGILFIVLTSNLGLKLLDGIITELHFFWYTLGIMILSLFILCALIYIYLLRKHRKHLLRLRRMLLIKLIAFSTFFTAVFLGIYLLLGL